MAFFNNENFLTPCTIPAVEGAQYDPDNGGAANIAMEAYEDQLNVVKAIHAADMAELGCKYQYKGMTESYVAEQIQVVQEASIKEIFGSIKDAIKKFFGKIATFFKKLYEKFFVYSKSNKSFAEKYKSVIKDVTDGTKVTVGDCYEYAPMTEILALIEKGVDKVEAGLLKPFATRVDEYLKELAQDEAPDVAKHNSLGVEFTNNTILHDHFGLTIKAADAPSVTTSVMTAFRGTKAKGDMVYDKSKVEAGLGDLAKLDASVLKKIEAKMTKEFGAILKTVDKAEKTYLAMPYDADNNGKKDACVKIVRKYHSNVVRVKSICLSVVGAFRTISAEYANQTKRATVALIGEHKKNKKEANKNK